MIGLAGTQKCDGNSHGRLVGMGRDLRNWTGQ